MKKLRGLFFLLLFALILMPNAAFADGFGIYEWSAGGVAMGEAYMFAEDDPSLLGYNPAGITRLQGSWISGGMSYINPRGRVDFHGAMAGGETWSNTEAPGYVPNLFYVKQQNDKLWWGIGVFSRFGNSSEYEPTWPGRYNSYLAKITGLTVQPTAAYKVTDKLSLAAGLDINYSNFAPKKRRLYLDNSIIIGKKERHEPRFLVKFSCHTKTIPYGGPCHEKNITVPCF